MSAEGTSAPDDLVVVGHITGAYGLQGWVKVRPYSADADALLHAKTWWLDKPVLRDVEMRQAKPHSGEVVASLMGVADRDAAESLRGNVVQIRRSHFPALADGEYYWVDLIGAAVENLEGLHIGTVADLMDNGAHPILRVTVASEVPVAAGEKPRETLIPFVDAFVKHVDAKARQIKVDWAPDY